MKTLTCTNTLSRAALGQINFYKIGLIIRKVQHIFTLGCNGAYLLLSYFRLPSRQQTVFFKMLQIV